MRRQVVPISPDLVQALDGRRHWSDAVIVGNLVFTTGQIGWNKQTGKLEDGFEAQAIRVFENLKEVLERCGSSMEKVAMTRIYLTDPENYPIFDEIYGRYFPVDAPARPDVVVKEHIGGALIDIEVVAQLTVTSEA